MMAETPSSRPSNQLNAIAIVLLIIVVAVVIMATRNRTTDSLGTPPTNEEVSSLDSTKISVTYPGEDGKTAYDILKEQYTVVADETAYGPMVKSINGEEAGDSTFWSFKVNGELAAVGAHQYTTKATDTITWELTAIE